MTTGNDNGNRNCNGDNKDNGNAGASWLGKNPGGEADFSTALLTKCVSSFGSK